MKVCFILHTLNRKVATRTSTRMGNYLRVEMVASREASRQSRIVSTSPSSLNHGHTHPARGTFGPPPARHAFHLTRTRPFHVLNNRAPTHHATHKTLSISLSPGYRTALLANRLPRRGGEARRTREGTEHSSRRQKKQGNVIREKRKRRDSAC